MNRLATTLAAMMLIVSLTACAQKPNEPIAAAVPKASEAPTPEVRKQALLDQLRKICPTPTQWTAEQKRAVAAFVDKHAGELGMELLAPEWKRLNDASIICRFGKVPEA